MGYLIMLKMKQFYQTMKCSYYFGCNVEAMSGNSCTLLGLLFGSVITTVTSNMEGKEIKVQKGQSIEDRVGEEFPI
jgi:hypothetical protein